MGAGIAEVCARAGSSVVVIEAAPEDAARCQTRIDAPVQRGVRAHRLTDREAESALARIDVATELAAAATAENRLGKTTSRSQDRAGFIVNALLIPYLLSAIRMLESGFASAEDIDAGMVQGCAHPQGPLALTDLIGLDTTAAVGQSTYEEFKEPLRSSPTTAAMVDAGLLGRTTGRGFYPYAR